MLKHFRSLFAKDKAAPANDRPDGEALPPREIVSAGRSAFPVASHLGLKNGLPILDWGAFRSWLGQEQSAEQQSRAWAAGQRAWLQHFRLALGPGYQLAESDSAILLSSFPANVARATLEHMERTGRRIDKVLEGIAQDAPLGKHVLIVFDDGQSCYNYLSGFGAAEGGDFAYAGGVHIHAGCSHYVTLKADLRALEPVIAHQMVHGCIAHLDLPLWLSEGLALNTEKRVVSRSCGRCRPVSLLDKHFSFWGEAEIQELWSGASFQRPDNGHALAYDLSRMLVEQLAGNWEAFSRFVLDAKSSDSGAASARKHLDLELGELVSWLLQRPDAIACSPKPKNWLAQPA